MVSPRKPNCSNSLNLDHLSGSGPASRKSKSGKVAQERSPKIAKRSPKSAKKALNRDKNCAKAPMSSKQSLGGVGGVGARSTRNTPKKTTGFTPKNTPNLTTPTSTASATPKEPQAPAAGTTPASIRHKTYKKLFRKKLFLDLKTRSLGNAKIRQLVEDIQLFGGTIEDFFSKDINYVLTDAPEWKLTNPSGNPDSISPGTPISASAYANSPWSPATPIEERKVARSRIDTIIERARIQAKGTSDVIENAHKWGIKIWSIHKFISWLEQQKELYGDLLRRHNQDKKPVTRSQSVDSKLSSSCDLRAPYIKFEVTNHQYRPVFHEFRKFPQIHLDGKPGTSPFYTPSTDNPQNSAKKKINRGILRDDQDTSVQQQFKDNHSKRIRLQKDTTPLRDQPHHQLAKDQQQQLQQRKSFCEICEVEYSDFDAHLKSLAHQNLINLNKTWAHLDFVIGLVNMNSDDSHPLAESDQ